MDEKAAHAVRTKRDSSMRVGLKLVREGKAAGFVTAGNTGAAMATAKMVLGALPGVDRPALATPMPTSKGNPCVLLDVGANVDCKAHNLEQFAVMGEMYARSVLKIAQPRVGLLSIGEEETKGNELTREALPAAQGPAHQLHRQRGGPRHLQRPCRRDRLRRLCGQRGAQDQRGHRPLCARCAARVAHPDRDRAGGRAALAARLQRFSPPPRLYRIRRRAAARRARRVHHRPRLVQRQSPSSTASAWPTSSPAPAPTSASSRRSPAARSLAPITATVPTRRFSKRFSETCDSKPSCTTSPLIL